MLILNNLVVLILIFCFNVYKFDFFYIILYLDVLSGFYVYSILFFDFVCVLGVFGSNGNVIKEVEFYGFRVFCMVFRGFGILFKNFFGFRK